MNLDRQAFANAVTFAARALPRNAAIPTLTGLRITGADGHVRVSAFDFDTYAEADGGPCTETFDVLIPGRPLAAYLGGMSGATLTLGVGERQADLTGGSARVTLPLLSLADYPSAPPVPASVGTADAATLAAGLDDVRASVDPNETVATLRGIVAELRSTLVLAGVHRHRCAVREVHGGQCDSDQSVILPVAVVDVAKAMAGTVVIGCDDGRFSLSDDSRTVVVRLMAGEPNPYGKLFDNHSGTLTVTCERTELLDALKWVASGDTRKETSGHLRMTVHPDGLTLALSGAEAMTATTDVEAKVEGDGYDIGWKAENLLHGLSATAAATIALSFASPRKPVLMTADTDPGFRYLGMPVTLSDAR